MIRYSPEEAASIREKLLPGQDRRGRLLPVRQLLGRVSGGLHLRLRPQPGHAHAPGGMVDEVLQSSAVQNCIQCITCSARCPRNIEIAGIFEDLKTIAIAKGTRRAREGRTFNRLFLENIAHYGRLSEAMFLVRFNLAAVQAHERLRLGLPMVKKGKMEFVPHKSAGADEVGRIYKKAMERARAMEKAR